MSRKGSKATIAIFDPPLKPRFFPGEVHEYEARADFRFYREHRLRCLHATPKVDNKAPRLDLEVYYRRQLMVEDAKQANFRCRHNLDVVKKINAVSRLGGKLDCWNLRDKKRRADREDVMKAEYARTELENRALHDKLRSLASELSPRAMAKQWRLLERSIAEKSRYPWFKRVSSWPSITRAAAAPADLRRTRCFFDLELGASSLPLGRIVFELYADHAPRACANFEAFCRGFDGLSYKGTPFHRVLAGYYCQGGDVTKFNGIGGASVQGEAPPDDSSALCHACPGVLATCGLGKAALDSKFYLTFRPLKTMDGKNVVFGKVVKGLANLLKVNAYGTKYGKPLQMVVVAECGVLPVKSSSRRSSERSGASDREIRTSK